MYFPIIEFVERLLRDAGRWFFVNFLFVTREARQESISFFETGRTNLRHFQWLNIGLLRSLYSDRWKYVLADFLGAYFKLATLGAFIIACGLYALQLR